MRYIIGRALSPPEVERAHRRRLRAALDVPGLGFWVGYADGNFVGWWILQLPTGRTSRRSPERQISATGCSVDSGAAGMPVRAPAN